MTAVFQVPAGCVDLSLSAAARAMSRAALRDLRRLQRHGGGAGAGVNSQLKALELVKNSGMSSHIMEKAASMKRGARKKKKAESIRTHKFEWSREAKRLHTQRTALERELREDELSPALAEALAEAEGAAEGGEAEELRQQIWNDYEECAVLVKSLRAMGGSGALRSKAQELMGALHGQLDGGLAQLHEEEERLDAELAGALGGVGSGTGSVPAACPVAPGLPEPEPEPEPQPRGKADAFRLTKLAPELASLRSHDEQLAAQLRELDGRAGTELERLAAQFAEGLDPSVAACERGGWEPRTHAVFSKLAREFGRNGQRETPAGRQRYMERLRLELPQCSAEQIEAHDRWYDKRRYLRSKRAAVHRRWKAERNAALVEAQYALDNAAQAAVEALSLALDRQAVEAKQAALHKQLAIGQAVKGHRQELASAAQAEAEAAEAAAQEKAAAERAAAMAEGKRRVEEWRAARAAEAAAALEAEAAASELELEQYRSMLEEGAERVAYRRQLEAERQEALEAKALEEEAEAAARQEVLDELAASVAPEATCDSLPSICADLCATCGCCS